MQAQQCAGAERLLETTSNNITKRVFVSVLCMQGADMHEYTCAVGMCCKGTSLGAALAQRNMHHAVQVLVGGGLGWRADSSQAP